ncbi:MAG TPA: hypothetical protein PKW33_03590 [Anaerolineaceae bacterium]|nr:hypothetical protein [Anaerolineaceae bacterium]HPN50645.1 hypothetical protein [Anaerolineaceae bacterium]
MKNLLISRNSLVVLLWLQFIPLVIFPLESFSPSSQEWWLPIVLTVLAMIGVFQVLVRKSDQPWPWYLMSFSQGFNLISRLMMVMPHATMNEAGTQVFNAPYVILSVISMALSVFYLWYAELPEVRMGMLRK